ncbi:AbfB domain-containing protein [Streptomyces sp. NRRL S-87]|uniref:AbfB domain-containing protein n=1 Tax=Streptomyces sp. NRRL S-87 TaxID=1463920 RepID=UPI0004BFD988|nr:AbfB domain-containing protein [Streptomyces sp. NRRL S-87]
MAVLKLSLFSNDLPDFFIIDRDGFADIAKIETEQDRRDATFQWTGPSLATFGGTGMLVRAVAPPGFCLRIATFEDFRIETKFFTGITDPQVKAQVIEESTFTFEAAEIDPNQASFRSVKFPDRFIRHRGFQLFAEPLVTISDLQSACFRIHAPLHPAEF